MLLFSVAVVDDVAVARLMLMLLLLLLRIMTMFLCPRCISILRSTISVQSRRDGFIL